MAKNYIKNPQFYWTIPGGIDLPKILNDHPPAFRTKIDYFYHILDAICDKMDYLDPTDTTKWARLSATRLQKFNRHYKKYLDYLESRGIIEVFKQYVPGTECRGYRIRSRFLDSRAVQIEVQNNIIKQKVKALKRKQALEQATNTKGHTHLTKWFNNKLRIDKEGAQLEVDNIFPLSVRIGGIKGPLKRLVKRFKAFRAIEKFHRQEFYYKVDDNIYRFHSNLTNIKKELRNYITYDGQTLVSMDIKNAQPLFSGVLLDAKFYDRGQIFSLFSLSSSFLLRNKVIKDIINIIMLCILPKSRVQKEFERYRKIIQSGMFYEEFSKIVYPNRPFDRKLIKEIVLTMFFVDNRHGPKLREREKPFIDAFPNVFKIFSLLKRHNKRILSNILQSLETAIVIEKATRRIALERPQLPIFTIHDSIATTFGNEDYVALVLEEEIRKVTGLTATIGKETWAKPVVPKQTILTSSQILKSA